MRERQPELDELGVAVYAVTFEPEHRIAEFRQKEDVPFSILRDPGRAGYRAFGLNRRSAVRIGDPRTLWYYIRRLLQGRPPERIRNDPYQLGGDVIISADGSGGWIYRSASPADRPPVDRILTVIREKEAMVPSDELG